MLELFEYSEFGDAVIDEFLAKSVAPSSHEALCQHEIMFFKDLLSFIVISLSFDQDISEACEAVVKDPIIPLPLYVYGTFPGVFSPILLFDPAIQDSAPHEKVSHLVQIFHPLATLRVEKESAEGLDDQILKMYLSKPDGSRLALALSNDKHFDADIAFTGQCLGQVAVSFLIIDH